MNQEPPKPVDDTATPITASESTVRPLPPALPGTTKFADSGSATIAPQGIVLPQDWQPLPNAARWPAYISWFLSACTIIVPFGFVMWRAVDDARPFGWFVLGALALCTWFILIAHWSWKNTAWKLDDAGLHVRRGKLWHKQILVPRTRVQHLDLERGPIERRFGLSTLVVHTAGTRFHALRQHGLREADAQALRDALIPRERVADDVI